MKSIGSQVKQFGILILLASLSVSCVNRREMALSAADRAAMKGKTFTVTSRSMPAHAIFKQSAMTAAMLTGAIGGAVAGGMAEAEGRTQVQRHHIANPNETMTRAVAGTLASRTGARQVPPRGTTTSLDPAKVAAGNTHADYVLDCFLTTWSGTYYPLSIGKYFLMVGAKMQLVETSSGRVVAEGFHLYQGNDQANAPNYDGIYANNAAFFKAETAKGVGGAINNFNGKF